MAALAADLGVRRTRSERAVNRLAMLALLTSSAVSAAAAIGPSQDAISAVLVAPPKAREVARRKENGMDTLSYRVTEPYPAVATLLFIRSAVETRGWRPLNEDFLNPGLASSHVRGWGTVVDQTVTPHRTLHSWHAQWTNAHGDMLLYHLEYHCALEDRRHSDDVVVSAAFIPKAVYEKTKAETRRHLAPSR
jgi:hypothetical protein